MVSIRNVTISALPTWFPQDLLALNVFEELYNRSLQYNLSEWAIGELVISHLLSSPRYELRARVVRWLGWYLNIHISDPYARSVLSISMGKSGPLSTIIPSCLEGSLRTCISLFLLLIKNEWPLPYTSSNCSISPTPDLR